MTLPGSSQLGGCLKKRAPRACESCRTRKVRCDVTRTKSPCTNCKLDGKTCVLPTSKRRHIGDRVISILADGQNPKSPICDAIIDFGDIQKPSPTAKSLSSMFKAELKPDFILDDFSMDNFPPLNSDEYPEDSLCWDIPDSDRSEPRTVDFASYPSPAQTTLSEAYVPTDLPGYIEPLPEALSDADLAYLKSRGCFNIPLESIRDELLRSYLKWVHPFTPMLDFAGIATIIAGQGLGGTINLVLFQSIMFAASAFTRVDLGLGDRKTTRRTLYERCKLLYDFDVESDRLGMLQAAILMSFWDGSMDQVRDSYSWIGVASLHADSIGIELDLEACSIEDVKASSLKRTWWSLLIRDRLLAVALRRPTQIKATRSGVPRLNIEDFGNEALVRALKTHLGVLDVTLMDLDTVAACCIALAELSICINNILSTQYVIQRRARSQMAKETSTVTLVPRSVGRTWSEVDHCGQELRQWCLRLPANVREIHWGEQAVANGLVTVHRSLLTAYHSMALMTLYRPLQFANSKQQRKTQLGAITTKMLFKAAMSITSNLANLCSRDLLCNLPDTAIASLDSALVTHLVHSMSEMDTVREISSQRFYLCWRMLLDLGETYYLADTTITMVNASAKILKESSTREPARSLTDAAMKAGGLVFPSKQMQDDRLVFVPGVQSDMYMTTRRDCGNFGMYNPWAEDSACVLEDKIFIDRSDVKDHQDADLFEQLICWDAANELCQNDTS